MATPHPYKEKFFIPLTTEPKRPKDYPNNRYDPTLYLTDNERYTFRFKLIDDKTHFTERPDPRFFENEILKIYYHVKIWDSHNKEVFNSYTQRAPMYNAIGQGQMVQCLEESMPFIPYGRKARVECCSDMCYGYEGAPGIGPNEPLRFEVELLPIDKQYFG